MDFAVNDRVNKFGDNVKEIRHDSRGLFLDRTAILTYCVAVRKNRLKAPFLLAV